MTRHVRTSLALVFCALFFPASSQASNYTFKNIVDTSDGYVKFDPILRKSFAINDNGEVVFLADLPGGERGVFFWDGSGSPELVQDKGSIFNLLDIVELNNDSQIVYLARNASGGFFVYRWNPVTGKEVIQDTDGIFKQFWDVSINNSGDVFVLGKTDTGNEAMSVYRDGVFGTYVDSDSLIDQVRGACISDDGNAYAWSYFSSGHEGIYVFADNSFSSVFDILDVSPDGGNYFGFDFPVCNSSQKVFFWAGWDDWNSEGFVLYDIAADSTDIIVDLLVSYVGLGMPSMNENGEVAFSARLDTGESGIFLGDDPVVDKVVTTGDILDGASVTRVVFGTNALNKYGDVIFVADLDDGRSGLFVAKTQRSDNSSNSGNNSSGSGCFLQSLAH